MATERSRTGTPTEIGGANSYTVATGQWKPTVPETTGWILMSVIIENSITALKDYPLNDLDVIRDKILYTPGNTEFIVTGDDTIPLLRSVLIA